MTLKRPQTIEKLDRHFIAVAAKNSTIALQMAMQVWNDKNQMKKGEIFEYVNILNIISKKLKDHCQYINGCYHADYEKQEIMDKKIIESNELKT
jgi:hypothetical protein